ncbi:PREDICTED: nucleoprotein TPR [Elephantulus edwardii]|uniref:nucleoprotein TPR n=1 Tax=Elephantulus edwardii TaxID=28737 RepID=UPI0003F08F27|nr:PREDICTED: nucleoprotein TPR [Elephantulus edwardii]
MAAVLQQVLERTELNKLPKSVQNKLEKFLADQQSEIDGLKGRHEKFKVESEQQYFEIEKRLSHSQERLVNETRECQNLRLELEKLNNQLKALSEKNKELEIAHDRSHAAQSQFTRTKEELEAEKRDLIRTNERLSQELEYLTEDVKCLNEKLKDSTSTKGELQLKLDELQASDVSVKYREKRLEQEKELLHNQNTWLNTELKTKTDELLALGREKGNEILELKCNLENKKEEVARMEEQMNGLKTSNEHLQKHVEDLLTKLKEAKEQQASMEEKFHNELNAHIKLSNLYKSAADDSEAKSNELTRAVDELHKLLKEAGEANKAIQDHLLEVEGSKDQMEKEMLEKIGKLEKELENANDLLSATKRKGAILSEEELAAMSPTAAAVAKIVKPGMKFTELYNAYMETQDQLLLEKLENKRINKYLDEIVKEVEAKAPILKRQREEYERAQKAVASLSAKLEQAMKEIQRLREDTDKANKDTSVLEKDNQRMKIQIKDLSQQIRVLLMELEEARGNHVIRDEEVSSADISSSSEVISQHLVSYRNIEELQEQNQRLLVALRELGQTREREEQETTSSKITELQLKLESSLTELEQLRESRKHQMQLVDSIVRQRDMYRILLSQTTGVVIPLQASNSDDTSLTSTAKRTSTSQSVSTPTPVPVTESTEAIEAKAALKQLQEIFENFKKEKADNEKIQNEQLEKLQEQVTDLRSQNTKISTQLDFASKRYEMLQDNVEGYRREITSLHERNQKLTATTQKQEQIINTMTQDLRGANEKLAVAEVRAENLKKEKEMLKLSEVRLSQQRESLLAEQRGQNLLLTNLQTIQGILERSETETKQRLSNQIEKLENEIAHLKKKLENEVEQRHTLTRNLDVQLLDTKRQLDTEVNLHLNTKELLKNGQKEIATLKLHLSSLEGQLASQSSQKTGKAQPNDKEDVDDLRSQLRQAEELVNDLKERLRTSTSNVEQYRAMVTSLEESLNKEKQVTEEVHKNIEVRLKESAEFQTQLEKKLMEVEKEKQELQDDKRKAIESMEQQLSELKKTLSSVQNEVQEALQRASTALSNEQQARRDCQEQAKIAVEAQNKYERELMLHAADVEALQAAKEQVSKMSSVRQHLEETTQKAESQLLECKASWEERERVLKDEVSKCVSRCEDLEKQNRLLHDQIEKLSDKVVASMKEGVQGQLNVSLSEEGKSQEQILEILRFIRREKEIAETRFEVAQVESLRYRQRVELLERELQELQDSLNAEREKVQVTAKTMAQHEELMKKTETMNVVMETNKMLREEKERLEQDLQQMQAKVRKLELDILPLQEANAELSEKSGMLQAEKKLLEEDVKRWKARNQHLVNQQKDPDTEEYRKLLSEKEVHTKRIQQLTEEIGKLKAEIARSNATLTNNQNLIQSLREDLNKIRTEKENIQKELDAKIVDIQEKVKTITQVKKIGRRYKTQYEELKAQQDKHLRVASTSEPPTANIKPTPVVSTPSKVTAAAMAGNKATPRASIRPMVTPANPTTTPTATVMPTTQVESQEAMQSEGPVEHVPVFGSTSGSVRSTSPNIQPSLSQPILTVQQQTQATAFVQPTQQSHPQIEPANQEVSPNIVEVVQSSPIERPSTSTAVFGTVSATPSSSLPKRTREEEEDSTIEASDQVSDDTVEMPVPKKLKSITPVGTEEEVMAEESTDGEVETQVYNQDSQDSIGEGVTQGDYTPMEDSEETSQSLQIDLGPLQSDQQTTSSQDGQGKGDDVIVIDSDDEEEEDDENDGEHEDYEEDEEDDDDEDDTGMGDEGEDSNEGTGSADGNDGYEADDAEGGDGTDPGTETEESMGGTESNQRAADSQNSGEGNTGTAESSFSQEIPREQQPSSASERHTPRAPQSPRRPPHPLPPRLTIHAPPQELGPPVQRIQMTRRQSVGRGLQLTPGIGGMQQHFFDDEDRTVPSTPTLVVPHRTDGFAEAIHSPQVAGVPRFRFGPPEDMPQTSSSHSDLGQLASQGGLGMYETPLFLAHEEESGGRSVPTTPLQVAAPVTVFTESATSDASEHASQSVPMVTTSTGTLSTTNETAAGDDGDEVFVEAESEGISSEAGLEIDSQQEEEPVQASDESDLPSTSQDPPSSSSVDTSSSQPKPFRRVRLQTTLRQGVRGRHFNRQRGMSHTMGGRGGLNRGNIN